MARRMTLSGKDHIDILHAYDLHIRSRTIFVHSVDNDAEGNESHVGSAMYSRLAKNLLLLENEPAGDGGDDSIRIVMNTIGGSCYDALGMVNRIEICPKHVTISVYGQSMSAGILVLQAGDRRKMAKDAVLMIHHAYSGGTAGHGETDILEAKQLEKLHRWQEKQLYDVMKVKNPKLTMRAVREMHRVNTYLSAQEALALGLIDEITEKKQ